MTRLSEHQIIELFSSSLHIQDLDDVSLVQFPGENRIAFKTDMLVASTDVPPTMTANQVARKSIVSCVSDFASKGIKPLAAMISIGLPKDIESSYILGLAAGFARACREFGVKIVGGDTNSSNDIVIDCSMIGLAKGKIPSRSGARAGDMVVVSGPFGYPSCGLRILMQGATAEGLFQKRAINSVLEPKPAREFGLALSKYFSASMDSSDGLALSLYTIASQSKVDITLDTLPVAKGLENFANRNSLNSNNLVLHGGEEYEIVCTIPRDKYKIATTMAKNLHLGFVPIGSVKAGTGKVSYQGMIVENKGYDHFAPLT